SSYSYIALQSPLHSRDLHSFPTRRSSDLLSRAQSGARNSGKPCTGRGASNGTESHSRCAFTRLFTSLPRWHLVCARCHRAAIYRDRKSTRLNSSHVSISYAVFCLKKKKNN